MVTSLQDSLVKSRHEDSLKLYCIQSFHVQARTCLAHDYLHFQSVGPLENLAD